MIYASRRLFQTSLRGQVTNPLFLHKIWISNHIQKEIIYRASPMVRRIFLQKMKMQKR